MTNEVEGLDLDALELARLRSDRERYGASLQKLAKERAFGGLIGDMPSLLMEAQEAVNRGRAEFRGIWPRGWTDQLYAQAAEAIRAVLSTDQARYVAALARAEAAERRAGELEGALSALIVHFEGDELHDEGAFDIECPDCVALEAARAILPATQAEGEK